MAAHYYVVVCVLFMIAAASYGANTSSISPSRTSSVTSTTVATPQSPTTKAIASETPITSKHNGTVPSTTPRNHSTASPATPGNHSTSSPATPKLHSSAVPLTNYTTARPTGNQKHSMKPGGHGDSRGKWVATGFAIFFGITTIVMTFLYFRQRKMNTELEGDSSLSRLI